MKGNTVAGVEELAVVCAGRGVVFGVEDAACTGAQARRRRNQHPETKPNDASTALGLKHRFPVGATLLSTTKAGQRVIEIGLLNDLARCAWLDRYRVVPEVEDRAIRVPPTSGKTWKGHR